MIATVIVVTAMTDMNAMTVTIVVAEVSIASHIASVQQLLPMEIS
jgi:hypothetical protein